MKYLLLVTLLYTSFCVNAQSKQKGVDTTVKKQVVTSIKQSADSIYSNTSILAIQDITALESYLDSKVEEKDFRKMIAYETLVGAINSMLNQRIEAFYKAKQSQK